MMAIETLLLHAIAQDGDRYILGAEAKPTDADPEVFDCSELVEWACGQAGVAPKMPDGSNAQFTHCTNHKTLIPVAEAIQTRGALLFVDKGAAAGGGKGNHVAFSLGNGSTIEARGTKWGVGMWTAHGRNWTHGARIPGCDYTPAAPPFPIPKPAPPTAEPAFYRYPSGAGVFLIPPPVWHISMGPCLLGVARTGQLYAMGPDGKREVLEQAVATSGYIGAFVNRTVRDEPQWDGKELLITSNHGESYRIPVAFPV